MNTLISFLKNIGRGALVALGYIAGIMLAGLIGAMLGDKLPSGNDSSLVLLFVASVLLGLFVGSIASRLALARRQHFILWASLILFNVGSVTIEGAFFAPDLVSISLPMLVGQQLLATLGAAFVIARVVTISEQPVSWMDALRTHPLYSWVWRFIVSAVSYVVFYFVFGGLNYQLITKPYYDSHAGGLTVPPANVVLGVESIRSVMIVFSVFLFLLSARGTRRQLMVRAGWLLFAIGGIIPLVWQINSLPFFLLASSAVEIFFQNFSTGAVAALLLAVSNGMDRS